MEVSNLNVVCCEAPFRLFCFPGAVRYPGKREKWIRLMKRQRADKSMIDELFLTLVRLRLGILNEHLADKFGVSPTVCSNTFKTWVRLLAVTLGSSLVCWLPREGIRDNLPEMFKKNGHYGLTTNTTTLSSCLSHECYFTICSII